MAVLLSAPLLMLAQAAAAAPATEPCPPQDPNSSTIVICAERPQGYRLDPDVMNAKRQARRGGGQPRPNNPAPRADCATVGPAPCLTAGINLLGAALTAAQMAKRLAEGREGGSMFVTDPQATEYEFYQAAKARREAEEAAKAAKQAQQQAEAETGK